MVRTVLALWTILVLLTAACAPATPAAPAAPARPGAGASPAAGAPAAQPGAAAPAAPQPPEAVKLGFAVLSPANAALLAAADGGIYQRHGLDVELVALGAGQTSQAAIIAGEVPAASASPVSAFNAVLAGGDVVIVGAVFDTIAYQIVSRRDLTAVDDLRGKTIGINRLGGGPHSALRYVMRQLGIDIDREVRVIQVGGQPERVAALRSGAVDATLVDPPFAEFAEREGFRVLVDTADMNVPYPITSLVVNGEFLRTRRDTAGRILQSVVDGTRAFRTDRELGIRTLKNWFKLDDDAVAAETYDYFSRVMPTEVLPRAEGLQVAWEEIPAEQRAGRQWQEAVDPSLAREVR